MAVSLISALGAENHLGDDDELGERVLDAAVELCAAYGMRNLTIDDLVARAQVGRMTIYRRFGDRRGLIGALIAREARRCLQELERASPPDAPIAEQLTAGILTSLRLVREHPLLSRLALLEPESALRALRDQHLFASSRHFLADRLRRSQRTGAIDPDVDVAAAAEVLVRLTFTFLLLPESELGLNDAKRASEFAQRMLVGMLAS